MGHKKKERFIAPSRPARMRPRQIADENYELGRVLYFDPIDLHANMDGNITSTQLHWLRQRWGKKLWGLVVGLPILVFFTGGCLVLGSQSDQNSDNLAPLCLGILGIYGVFYVFNEARELILLARDIRNHEIRWVTGQAKIDAHMLHFTKDVLTLDGVNFTVSSIAFKRGRWYTVYYVPHSRTIISAEISRPEDFEARLEQSVITLGADGEIEVS